MNLRKRLYSVLFWSIISAAFIGPGTVTTAAAAGAGFGTTLLWALIFSTLATILLLEASARITITSGMSLGEAISLKYSKGHRIKLLITGSIVFGCAAYQTGNILGAISGVELIFGWDKKLITTLLVIVCSSFLWFGHHKHIANIMGVVVAVMGFSFMYLAFSSSISINEIVKDSIIPSFPSGSSLLVIGLIGTTIVPYNIFLASGISRGQNISEMRFGITAAVLIGGLISIAVLITGTSIEGEFSFQSLSRTMMDKLGSWGGGLLGLGLFAAGFTSSITAPLASSVTAQSIYGQNNPKWENTGRNYRLIWVGVIFTGWFFSMLEVKPIPMILLAQAINGFLLPFVSYYLYLLINDPQIMPEKAKNSRTNNVLLIIVIAITGLIGLINVLKAISVL